jgi:hypothetical protein
MDKFQKNSFRDEYYSFFSNASNSSIFNFTLYWRQIIYNSNSIILLYRFFN